MYTRVDPMARNIAERAVNLGATPDPLYGYARMNPIFFVDPTGLAVYLCKRPNEIPQFDDVPILDDLPHKWLKTPTKEAGLGPLEGGVPGDEAPACECQWTSITNHAGESTQPGAVCREVKYIDEDCVNEALEIGEPKGRWLPLVNDCNTFANRVIAKCRTWGPKNPGRPGYRQSPL